MAVPRHKDISRRVMEIIVRSSGCVLEDVVSECPDLTWNQVFLEVDRLSREGYVILNVKQRGYYSIKPAEPVIRPS
jgi:hypothetical protein